jgi:hypothetical protein
MTAHFRWIAVFLVVPLLVCGAAGKILAQPLISNGPPRDADGWTVFKPSPDTRIIYVSSSTGNDRNGGQGTVTAVKTIARGLTLLRDGHPDWLLLRKGDTWIDQSIGYFGKNGRSAAEPMLVSSYGTGARPLIKTNPAVTDAAINTAGAPVGNFLAIVGLEFYAYTRDPSSPDFNSATVGKEHSGISFLSAVDWLLIEDCKFSFYQVNAIQGWKAPSHNVALRRNVIVDSYSTNSHSGGFYFSNIFNLVLEGNVFDHNGLSEAVPNAGATIYNHNVYIQYDCGPATLIGNIFANASSHGSQVRPGGTVIDNLYVHNPIGLLVGSGQNPTVTNYSSRLARNVFLEGSDIDPSLPRGFGIDVGSNTGTVEIKDNIIANEASSRPYGYGIGIGSGVTAVTVSDNVVYRWDSPVVDQGVNNAISGNSINPSGLPDPARGVETYNASRGGESTLAGFLSEVRKQSRDHWRPEYTAGAVNNYIRMGFARK